MSAPGASYSKDRLHHNGCNGFDEVRFRYSADNLLRDLTIFEQNKVGNTTYTVLCWRPRVVVHIHFDNLEFPCVFTGKLINNRSDRATRATPRRPKVDQHGNG